MASESGCPIEMHKIEIAKCDEMYDRDCKGGRKMPFHRAIYDSATGQSPNLPREQVRNTNYTHHYSLSTLLFVVMLDLKLREREKKRES